MNTSTLSPVEKAVETFENVGRVRLFSGEVIPLEMHKARIVQKINLLPTRERVAAMQRAGNNTFLLRNDEVFLDMLTDSGVNAMSDMQQAAMMMADDSYAGSETFFRLESALRDFFGMKHFLPAHQGRACENILATGLIRPGQAAVMNYHFTTAKAHITRVGGRVIEVLADSAMDATVVAPFKGDFDMEKLEAAFVAEGRDNIAFVRVEAGTNLIGGQPISLGNMREVSAFCKARGLISVLDASLLSDNLYFMKTREALCASMSTADIVRELGELFDIIYFSGRKLGFARGGGICLKDDGLFDKLKVLVPLYEGFLTYGGMSVREMEAMRVGLAETLDMDVISQTPQFVAAFSDELTRLGVPVVRPSGGLGCHIDASAFVPHIPSSQYPAAALAAAVYIVSGARGMERGTLSEQRNPDGSENPAQMELLRLAIPKRVFTLSHIKFAADRIGWLFRHRERIGGLRFVEEPETLRFFLGRLEQIGGWQERLAEAFEGDMQ